ncbi:MAG TPA: hypothetical protein DEP35_05995 [Deltaproteobacteria bacterium]|nr:hypothetical protein [Deltaproteobacteria bacterium]
MIGRGGGHGQHGGGGGWVGPWGPSVDELELELERRRRGVMGQELFSTGEGALVILGLVWWLSHEADKRVPR